MAIPRVFLSSTCYDLAPIRDTLGAFIESFGFQPCLSDRGDVFYHPDLHTHDSCISEIRNCQLLVLLIGGRFGGTYQADFSKSIVNAEFAAARELNVPVFAFIKKDVLDDHRLFQHNRTNAMVDQIAFPSIEKHEHAKRIFQFIDDVRQARTNNGFFSFEYSRDVELLLRKQWSGMMFDFLQRRQLSEQFDSQNKLLSALTATSSQLEALVKELFRKADGAGAEAVIQGVELKSAAEKFFRDLLRDFGIAGFTAKQIERLQALSIEQTWDSWLLASKDFHLEYFTEEGETYEVLFSDVGGYGLTIGGQGCSERDRQRVAGFAEGFASFRQLPASQRNEVLAQLALSKSAA